MRGGGKSHGQTETDLGNRWNFGFTMKGLQGKNEFWKVTIR